MVPNLYFYLGDIFMVHLHHYNKEDKLLVAVDCIIFGFDETLKILMVRRNFEPERGQWSLIGGFVRQEEDLDQAAARILKALTGIDHLYMEQLYAFSKVDRDPAERTISVAYFSLIPLKPSLTKVLDGAACRWFEIQQIPKTIFDHGLMIEDALKRLRRRATHRPIGFELLPEKFTMKMLQDLYEAILDKTLDKRNFINKINSFGILERLDEKDKSGSKKGAFLYRFNEEQYREKLKEGLVFKI